VNESEQSFRRDFHFALPFGIIPGLGALVSFLLARRAAAAGGAWARRLKQLAGIDVLVLVCVSMMFIWAPSLQPARHAAKVHIGIQPKESPGGVGVESLSPGWPAERAGLKAGDVLLAVDGVAIHKPNDLIDELNRRPQEPRELSVQRGESKLQITVTPAKGIGLFTPQGAGTRASLPLWSIAQIALTIVALFWLALRARARQVPVLPAVLILGTFVFGTAVQQLTGWAVGKKLGGVSTGGWLISTLAFAVSLLAASAWSLRLSVRRGIVPAPHWNPPPPALVGRGLLYVVSLGARAGVLAWAFWSLTGLIRFLPATDPWGLGDELPQSGAMFFALGAVAIGPAAEEILFRGVFLPWLERFFTARQALLVSAGVFGLQHIAYGPGAAYIVVIGLVLGWARQRTGGLAAPLFIHTVNNACVTLLRLAR
jgi:membrane protease YdiL (CAAX protease family)